MNNELMVPQVHISRTLVKVARAGNINPDQIPTKIYIKKGEGSIVALEPAAEIAKRYKEAMEQGSLLEFTDYRGNPSAILAKLVKGYSSLCSEQQLIAVLKAHADPIKVQNIQPLLGG